MITLKKLQKFNYLTLAAGSSVFFGFLTVAMPSAAILSYSLLIVSLLSIAYATIYDVAKLFTLPSANIGTMKMSAGLGIIIATVIIIFFVVGILTATW